MNKVVQYLGLAQRAGKMVTGEELVIQAIRHKQVKLVVLAGDASDNTRKKIQDKCASYQVPLRIYGDRNLLGSSLGKEQRVTLGVKDSGFAQELLKLIDIPNEGGSI
jgi:ribosomal protein L7Ae-like RNA K-turn-binding protein